MLKVGYLGPSGTYSEKAAKKYIKTFKGVKKILLYPCENISKAFQKLNSSKVDEIIVPAENSIEGTVNITLDLLYLYKDFYIKKEIIENIKHYLLSKEKNIENIKNIYSHPQALAQCSKYIEKNLEGANVVAVDSTAKAALIASKTPNAGAIASLEVAKKYNLNILATTIQDYKTNTTCFWVIGRKKTLKTGNDKTSLVVALPQDKPGGLYNILEIFAVKNINLTKIVSRPTKKEFGEYLFYIDFEGHESEENVKNALEKLSKKCSYFRVLGSYSRGGF